MNSINLSKMILKKSSMKNRTKQVEEIANKQINERSERENLLMVQYAKRFPILKKLSNIIEEDIFFDLIQNLKIEKESSKQIIHHIGDQQNTKLYLILRGKVKLYNFKEYDIDIQNREQMNNSLNKHNSEKKIWYIQNQIQAYYNFHQSFSRSGFQSRMQKANKNTTNEKYFLGKLLIPNEMKFAYERVYNQSFEGLSFIFNCGALHTAIAETDCTFLTLDSRLLQKEIQQKKPSKSLQLDQISQIPLFAEFNFQQKVQIYLSLEMSKLSMGTNVFKQNDEVKSFFIVKSGLFCEQRKQFMEEEKKFDNHSKVLKQYFLPFRQKKVVINLNQYQTGSIIGIKSLLTNNKIQKTSLICTTAIGEIFSFSKDLFMKAIFTKIQLRNYFKKLTRDQGISRKIQQSKVQRCYLKNLDILQTDSKGVQSQKVKMKKREDNWVKSQSNMLKIMQTKPGLTKNFHGKSMDLRKFNKMKRNIRAIQITKSFIKSTKKSKSLRGGILPKRRASVAPQKTKSDQFRETFLTSQTDMKKAKSRVKFNILKKITARIISKNKLTPIMQNSSFNLKDICKKFKQNVFRRDYHHKNNNLVSKYKKTRKIWKDQKPSWNKRSLSFHERQFKNFKSLKTMLTKSDYCRRQFKNMIIKVNLGTNMHLKDVNQDIFQNIIKQSQKIQLVNKMLNADKPVVMNKYYKALNTLSKSLDLKSDRQIEEMLLNQTTEPQMMQKTLQNNTSSNLKIPTISEKMLKSHS